MKFEEDGSDLITLPRPCNHSGSCILHRLKLLLTFLGTKIMKGRLTLFTWGSIDIVVSKIAPMFLACGEGLIISV